MQQHLTLEVFIAGVADKRIEFYRKLREGLKQADKEDKLLDRQHRREKRRKEKMKRKRCKMEADEGDNSEQDNYAEEEAYLNKKAKIYFGSDNEREEVKENKNKGEEKANRKESIEEPGVNVGSMSLEDQEALALKLSRSMH